MKKSRTASRTQTIALCGLAIALLTVASWITVPLGPIPFTLQTFMLVFIALALAPHQAVIAVLGYLVLGTLGVPVFAGMSGGLASLLGPSGGFLSGFGIGACLAAILLKVWREPEGKAAQYRRETCAAVIILSVSYLCGWLQLMVVADLAPMAAFLAGIAPFVIFDVIKAAVGIQLAHMLKAAVPALRNRTAKPRA